MTKAKKRTDRRDLPFDEFVKCPPELNVLTDHPLTPEQTEEAFEADTFDFRYKLGPLYDILRSPETKTPMAVLISGDWGTGKTSAMSWIEGLLQKWNKTGPKNRIKVRPVWFYPWKYDNKEDVRRGLIAEVIIKSIDVENISTRTVISAAKKFGMFLGKSFIHALASIKLKGQVSADAGTAKAEAGAEVDLASIKEILSEYQQAAHPEKAFLNEFETTLRDWVQDTIGKDGKERMVIFIDDLDRCMPEIALQVLEALKLYLNIPNLIFVLGVDRDVVEKLVVEHYRKLGLIRAEEKDKGKPPTEEEKTKSEKERTRRQQDEEKAKLYLSKMFQVEIELSTKEEQITKFFDESLARIPLWKKKLSPDHQMLFRGLVLNLSKRNPREVKRILNSAFMSGAGAEMIKVNKGEQPPGFEQGLQDFFIRRILRKPQYERIAAMIDTDEGRKFLRIWSQVARKVCAKNNKQLDDVLPGYMMKDHLSEKGDD
jgi:hypothetical protein